MLSQRKGWTKRCCHGVCNSDTRSKSYRDNLYYFILFPKPCLDYRRKRIKEVKNVHIRKCKECSKCKLWVKLCGRADGSLKSIDDVTRDTHICSLHFIGESGPSEKYPEPITPHQSPFLDRTQRKRTSLAEKYKKTPAENHESNETVVREHVNVTEEAMESTEQIQKQCHEFDEVLEHCESDDIYSESLHAMEHVTTADDCSLNTTLGTMSVLDAMYCEESQADNSVSDVMHSESLSCTHAEAVSNNVGDECNVDSSVKMVERGVQTHFPKKKTVNKKIQASFSTSENMGSFQKSIEENEKKCLFYTGLLYTHILVIYKFVSPSCNNLKYWGSGEKSATVDRTNTKTKFTPLQELILVLVRLRVGLLVEDLAYRFDVSTGLVSKIVTTWVQFLNNEFTVHFKPRMFPSRRIIAKTLPKTFKSMKNIRALIDCTEFYCQSPSNFEQQGNMYSSYKAHSTFKVLIGCTPNGCICFVSDVYEGSISDREIVVASKFADLLEPGDLIVADRGFTIHDILEAKGAHLNIPPFLNGRNCLTPQEEIETKRIAKQRIYVEHAVGKIKQFRLLQRDLPLNLRGQISQIVFICACLANFQPPLVLD